jgi:tetratricopeptide (TPR) repeat protein
LIIPCVNDACHNLGLTWDIIMTRSTRYRAFISYNHADKAWAERIHRDLETYRLPSRLVGQVTSRGEVPKRLTPIFRDRDDLPAAENLTDAVREALGRSDSLIVVCSPAAAQSRWVNEEILTYRALNPEGQVFTAIVGGEPMASLGTDHPERECFPSALLEGHSQEDQLEPLAADFRPDGDGRRIGLIKLVAGLLGLRLDQILQRDLQRRQRRVTAITTASMVLALTMGAMTLFALSAQSEAEQRKAQAEDLIEFMLEDLRVKLEPVGRLDVLDAVGEKVVEYYAIQDLDGLTLDDLGRRSRAFLLLGRVGSDNGEFERAIGHFREAYDATRRALDADPADATRIFEHAQSAYWMGSPSFRAGDYIAAEPFWLEYRDLARQLVEIDASNIEWASEDAYGNTNMGILYLRTNRLELSQSAFTQALDIRMTNVDRQPNLARAWLDISNTHQWMSGVAERLDGRDAAIESNRTQIEIFDTHLADYSDNWTVRFRSLAPELALSRMLLSSPEGSGPADVEQGRSILTALTPEIDALLAHDPENTRWRATAIWQRLFLANAHLMAENPNLARVSHLEATRLMASPSFEILEGTGYLRLRVFSTIIEAAIQLDLGAADLADTLLNHALATMNVELARMDAPQDLGYEYALAANTLAILHERRDDVAGAREIRGRMVETLEPLRGYFGVPAAAEFDRAVRLTQSEELAEAE